MINNDIEFLLLKEKIIYNLYGINSPENRYKLNNNINELKHTPIPSSFSINTSDLYSNSTTSYKPNPQKNYKNWQKKVTKSSPYVPTGKGMNFTLEDYLNSGQETYRPEQLDSESLKNANNLIEKVNSLGELIPYDGKITSGYRSPERQKQIYERMGETPKMGSKHLSGHALDIYDPDGKLKEYLLNEQVLERAKDLDLYFENFANTPNWVHIQDEAPAKTGGQIWSADNLLGDRS